MLLSDKMAYRQVIGCLMLNPLLFLEYSDIYVEDFDLEIARICFLIIKKLYKEGATKIAPIEVDQEIEKYPNDSRLYHSDNGLDFLKICYEFAELENFSLYYTRLKKYSLLRRLLKDGYNIKDFYCDDKSFIDPLKEQEIQARFDQASIEDILNSVEGKYNIIRNDFLQGGRKKGDPGEGIFELIENLRKTPNIGPSLEGKIFSTACRGAREGCFYLKSSSSGSGKALPNSVYIPTPKGFKQVKDIKIGDYLFDAFGKPTKVLGVYPQGVKEVWEVIFKDGRIAHCCQDHLWSYCTVGQSEKNKANRKFFTKTLKQLLNENLKGNENEYKILVPMQYAVEYEKKELYPSPYAMGALLGDGSFRYGGGRKILEFSSADEELVKYVADELKCGYKKNSQYNYSWTFKKNKQEKSNGQIRKNMWVEEILCNYPDLWNAKSENKFIPKEYLFSSIDQRIELLNGLLDTDGTIGEKGRITYNTISPKLCDNVVELCRSLGFKTHVYKDSHKPTNICYVITIAGRPEDKRKLFKLSRKKEIVEKWYNNGKRKEKNEFNPIVKIQPCGYKEEMTCFYVDNNEHLFLTEDYIVTHNTRTSIFDACKLAYPIRYSHVEKTFIKDFNKDGTPREPYKILFIVTEMDKEELQTIMLAYLSGVNEEKILTGSYDFDEHERIKFAGKIMQKYHEYFIIEEISDPNLVNVESTIKKYATIDHIKYCFFDYIHSTASMIAQFQKNGINESTILMMMANQLKQLAKDYGIFIFSATQVNMSAMNDDGEFKNEMSIRSSKAVADKADLGMVMTKINQKNLNSYLPIWQNAVKDGILDEKFIREKDCRPTHVLDIYKNRRGRFKNVRIWINLDLGTGARQDCFMTTSDNEPFREPIDTFSSCSEKRIDDWKNYFERN